VEARAGSEGTARERARGGHRAHRIASLEPARPQPLGHARLELAQRGWVQEPGLELGRLAGDLLGRGREQRPLMRHHQDARGRLRQVEAVEAAVELERLDVQLRHHRVERVLDRAGVAARGGRAHVVVLVELDLRSGLGQERRRGAADDPAPHDGDVRGAAHSPLA
jgi:hypothetical protein